VEEEWPVCMGIHGSAVNRGQPRRGLEWRSTREEVVVLLHARMVVFGWLGPHFNFLIKVGFGTIVFEGRGREFHSLPLHNVFFIIIDGFSSEEKKGEGAKVRNPWPGKLHVHACK